MGVSRLTQFGYSPLKGFSELPNYPEQGTVKTALEQACFVQSWFLL